MHYALCTVHCALVIRCLTMFVNIKTFFLDDSVTTQTMHLIYNIEYSKASDKCEQSNCY